MEYLTETCGIDMLAVGSCHRLFDGIAIETCADCAAVDVAKFLEDSRLSPT